MINASEDHAYGEWSALIVRERPEARRGSLKTEDIVLGHVQHCRFGTRADVETYNADRLMSV
jgi:hypothetical protein